jgi:hypothetical protein
VEERVPDLSFQSAHASLGGAGGGTSGDGLALLAEGSRTLATLWGALWGSM